MISELFKLLGDPTRLRIIAALGAQELCVCDVATCLEMTQSAISHQLALLKHARLVRSRRDGKTIFYALDDGHVGDLLRIARKHIEENGDVP
jgi:ArsR family transcriptional regulator